ncbi:hypothetical protein PUN28_000522 [Cardiocondyla obscurior]|uniref:Uncharacterized protein n=1 Tax=Cardiocondyla obscurior TaxID=286306 RepID=A0AAW2GZX5_9HYME
MCYETHRKRTTLYCTLL